MATRQREKALKIEQNRDKRPTAIARYIRIPADKVGIVLDLIRGKSYDEAIAILNHTHKSASPVIIKIIESAAANAENNLNLAKDTLYVAECWVMVGPTLKRMMPRARGRADRLLKRTCHIRVILDERKKDEPQKIETKKTAPKKTESKKSENKTMKTTTKKIPVTKAEKPLANEPNAKKPLGAKKVAVKGDK